MGTDDGTRGWGPALWAEIRRSTTGGSGRWLREEGQVDWVSPNQSSMHPTNHASVTQQPELNGNNNGKFVNSDINGRNHSKAEIFKNLNM